MSDIQDINRPDINRQDINWVNGASEVAENFDTEAAGYRQKKAEADKATGLRGAFNAISKKPYYARKLAKAEHAAAAQRKWMQPRMAEILSDMGKDAVIERDGPDSRNAELVARYDEALFFKQLGELIDDAQPLVEKAVEKARDAEFYEKTDIIPTNAGLSMLSTLQTGSAADKLVEASKAVEKVRDHLERGGRKSNLEDAAPEIKKLFDNKNMDAFVSVASELVGGITSYQNAKKLDKAATYMQQTQGALKSLETDLGPEIQKARKDEMALSNKARDLQTGALMDKVNSGNAEFDTTFVNRLSAGASYDPSRPAGVQNTVVQAAEANHAAATHKQKAPGQRRG